MRDDETDNEGSKHWLERAEWKSDYFWFYCKCGSNMEVTRIPAIPELGVPGIEVKCVAGGDPIKVKVWSH